MRLTVGDLFCGAGGFSEGFRQAGFEIVWAVDNWSVAAETFKKNHPTTKVLVRDILELQAKELRPVDVLIGSPPCTHFSLANKGGKGDKGAGMELVTGFLRLVRELNPKYWLMENVPLMMASLKENMDGNTFPLYRGVIDIPRREMLLSADYGTPQTRRRFFSGEYPLPQRTCSGDDRTWTSLRDVLEGLPDPCQGMPEGRRFATDPLYKGIRIGAKRLRDHFEDVRWRLKRESRKRCEREKRKHGVYGKMRYPDSMERPCRTITAVRASSSRSTIVVDCPHHENRPFRTLTARECASVQGFPITYQFWSRSISVKDRLIGNAVPPPVARALAQEILREEGVEPPNNPVVFTKAEIPDRVKTRRSRKKKYSLSRRFRQYVEIDWRPDCRIELDNSGLNPKKHPINGNPHIKEWVTRLYLGYAKEYRCYEVEHNEAVQVLKQGEGKSKELYGCKPAFERMMKSAQMRLKKEIPDATTLQAKWARRTKEGISPYKVVRIVENLVNEHLPKEHCGEIIVPKSVYGNLLPPLLVEKGVEADDSPPKDMPIRTLGALLCLSLSCDLTNTGSQWVRTHKSYHHTLE